MTSAKDDLDFRKVEVFYWVAELKSFSLAAEHLFLRQPTVSAHIRELEEKLGSKILNRVGGEVTPTALGQLLMERAKALLALKRETLAALDHFQGKVKGELLIGGSNIPGEYILPRKLGAFIQKYPEVKPILRIGDSAGIVEAVLDGGVELGFVGFKGEDRRLSFQKIWKDEMVLVVPKNHSWSQLKAVDLKDLWKEGFISRERGSGTLRSFRNLLSRKGEEPEKLLNVIMELGSTEAIKEALIAGLGVSILSKSSIRREIQDGLLKEVPIRGHKLERDFYQLFHRRRTLSPISQAFIHFLKHH
ncbi:MAG: LysR family transcriptional regulator [Deltaproteobacteria bacterium]|nr:LysR family transcriptional regulator [Deltaproteobacteria bacterium]MCZ6626232.1 selenium metabolism-associated LysR family transcriptional regulator [Deltaproteobacteria bacterium]